MKTAKSFLLLSVLALGACSDVKEGLGVGRNSPDEFTVVKRAPLTLPPDYALRPPTDPNAPMPAQSATAQAREAVLGARPAPAADGADGALLAKLGTGAADPDIRKKIDEENGYIALKNQPVSEKLVFWGDRDSVPSSDNMPSSVVDAAAEKARIEKNKAEGKPLNAGDVPVIEKKKSTLDKIF